MAPSSGLTTKTPGLFDNHLRNKNIHLSCMQTHFHAPAEHAIDGKIHDLEMHIVHAMPKKEGSQFSNGVLGFIFKVVPDEYFAVNSDYHDQWLTALVAEYRGDATELDMTAFVENLNADRRWTYQGGLTTPSFAEGILWNVIEQVIPIRQSTLDAFNMYRKIEDDQVTDKFGSDAERRQHYASLEQRGIPDFCRVHCKDGDCKKRLFRTAICSRQIQDPKGRPVYHIDAAHQ